MSDNQTLYLFLCLIYLAECLVWAARRSVVFTDAWRRARWRARRPGDLLGNTRGSFVPANPLPPFGEALRCAWLPVAIAPGGICNASPQTPPGCAGTGGGTLALTYDGITRAGVDGRRLLLNNAPFALCATPGQAAALATLVTRLRDTPADGRAFAIRAFLAARFDAAAVSARLAERRSIPPTLPLLCHTLFALMYVVIPAAAFLVGAGLAILCGLPLILALGIWIACLFLRAHRQLYPASRGGRASAFLSLLLCPPAAIRARDRLTLDLMEAFDPAAVHLALGATPDTAFYAAVARDLAHPLDFSGGRAPDHHLPSAEERAGPHGKDGTRLARETKAWFLAEIRRLTEARLAAAGIDPAGLRAPPPHRPGEVYCPRCHALFTRDLPDCPDCYGVHTCG
jgi:hypothetical protein